MLTPIAEFLDRWDAVGFPMNDTELRIFGFVLVVVLVLLVSRLGAALDRLIGLGSVFRAAFSAVCAAKAVCLPQVCLHSPPPLRI